MPAKNSPPAASIAPDFAIPAAYADLIKPPVQTSPNVGEAHTGPGVLESIDLSDQNESTLTSTVSEIPGGISFVEMQEAAPKFETSGYIAPVETEDERVARKVESMFDALMQKYQTDRTISAQSVLDQGPPPFAVGASFRPAQQQFQHTIEDCGQCQLSLLDDRFANIIREHASRTGGSVANVIAGVLTRIGDEGNLGDFSLNPRWMDQIHASGQSQLGQPSPMHNLRVKPKCEHCEHEFKAERLGQRYCCTMCGKLAAGYKEDGTIPHDSSCTTIPGLLFKKAQEASKAAMAKKEARHATEQQQAA